MKNVILTALFLLFAISVKSQDTFSIVAMDPVTGEVGSAGASCVDLDVAGVPTDDFLGELFPGVGAINTQAWYIPANQTNARNRMNEGYTPSEIIDWLINNDVQNQPQLRQYGIVGKVGDNVESAAHTGSSTDDYKGHILGPNYAIQGNILLGPEVLEGMEQGFLNAEGDLACKLMGAMQGANIVGADTRCTSNGTSSLFAYIKVAQPSDIFGEPSFLVSLRTGSTDQIEPIDELQLLFDAAQNCEDLGLDEVVSTFPFQLYPNPSQNQIKVSSLGNDTSDYKLRILSISGQVVSETQFQSNASLDVTNLSRGMYFISLTNTETTFTTKWIKN